MSCDYFSFPLSPKILSHPSQNSRNQKLKIGFGSYISRWVIGTNFVLRRFDFPATNFSDKISHYLGYQNAALFPWTERKWHLLEGQFFEKITHWTITQNCQSDGKWKFVDTERSWTIYWSRYFSFRNVLTYQHHHLRSSQKLCRLKPPYLFFVSFKEPSRTLYSTEIFQLCNGIQKKLKSLLKLRS